MNDTLIGRQLANYRVDRLLGSGGMAQVYYGWDVKLERPVAIKVIDARYRDDPAYAERFIREARTVAAWRHDNILQIYYADDEDGLYFFAMEYIDGLDLGQVLAQYSNDGELMGHEDVLLVGRAIAQALDYAHEQGVIHRDVKPSNVMVTAEGCVVLTDFGLAMDVYQGSLGQVFGSPHYISPEQARSSADVVPQSDLYSLGVVLYEMLTGVVPFDDPSATTVALHHLNDPPPPPREVNPRLSVETEAVLLQILSKRAEERYETGQALMGALQEALEASPAAESEVDDLPPPPPDVEPADSRQPSRVSLSHKVASLAKRRAAVERRAGTDASLLGQQLDEYRLDALLGQGGMARIYSGLDVRLQRRVAIKVIDSPFREDAGHVERFEREAQAIARLEHPNIVRLYRYGEDKGVLYMAMQYIKGSDLETTLAAYSEAGQSIAPQEAARIVRQIAQALDYAHDQGVIHRDIKASNVMLDEEGHVYLADFGLALLNEFGTRGEVFGSPRYIAPEQVISSANVVPQSDLYSLGVIVYRLFTGDLPFEAEDPFELARLHMSESPRPPREIDAEISPELEAAILKMLAKEPTGRYQTGAELADALEGALGIAEPPPAPLPEQEGEVEPEGLSPPPAAPREEMPPPPPPAAVSAGEESEGLPPPPAKSEETARQGPPPPKRSGKKWLVVALIAAGACVILTLLTVIAYLIFRPALGSIPFLPQATGAAETPPATLASAIATTSAPTGLQTSSPTPTATSLPTPSLVPSAAPSPTPVTLSLLLVARREDSLFLVNTSDVALPLSSITLSNDIGELNGDEWGIPLLEPGECVAVWKDARDPQPPEGLTCEPLGEQLIRTRDEIFWKQAFVVYYEGEQIGDCAEKPEACEVEMTP
jgi:serine/threonine protein kinase